MTTSIQKDSLLGQLSTLAYKDQSFLNNPANIPAGWTFVKLEVEGPFAAAIFKNAEGQLAIAFRGTNGLSDLSADGKILTGGWNSQVQQGMDLVKKVFEQETQKNGSFNKSQLLVLAGVTTIVKSHRGFDA